ncbi:MAG: hypothetical protein ABIG39_07195 [Candidatus Micrarchaeota archaeon]
MYLSSSRKPSLTTKRLCRALSKLLPRGAYENRGKKSIDSIVSRARKLGKSRVLLIYEDNGNPEKIIFMQVGKDWGWLSPEIMISKLGVIPQSIQRSNSLKLSGPMASKLSHLFNLETSADETDCSLLLGKTMWSFYIHKRKLFSFGVLYA